MLSGRPRFWPWSPKAAFVTALVLLLVLLGLLVASRMTAQWPANRDVNSLIVPVLFVVLIPVLLLVVEGLAARGGSIDVAGVSLSFASTSQAAAAGLQTTTLSQNLGTAEDAVVQSSSLTSILDALRAAHRSDVTVVDLGRGQTWWESRLFILVAGAAERDRPRVIAFMADQGGLKKRFLGWAEPARLLDVHLQASPELSQHYARAQADVAQWRLGSPAGTGPGGQSAVILPWGGQQYLPMVADGRADPSFALELFLQAALDDASHLGLRRPVNAHRLQDLYGAELITDAIDVSADTGRWAAMLTTSHRTFFALTDSGSFKGLVPRDSLVAALVARLLEVTGVVAGESR
jgi:hypothetical protein